MIKSLEAQGLQLAKEKQEYLGWLEGRAGLLEDPGGCLEWGLAGSEEPDASLEPGELTNQCPVGQHDRGQESLVVWGLGSGPSVVTYLSAVYVFRQHSLSKPHFPHP